MHNASAKEPDEISFGVPNTKDVEERESILRKLSVYLAQMTNWGARAAEDVRYSVNVPTRASIRRGGNIKAPAPFTVVIRINRGGYIA